MNHQHIQQALLSLLDRRLGELFTDSDGFEVPDEGQGNDLRTLRNRIAAARSTPELNGLCYELLQYDGEIA